MRLDAPADPPDVTRLTEIATLPALVFVTVNLSMIARTAVAVYCVVCAFSACLGGIRTFGVTAMLASY
jgi:hypothetical protein